jgi:hypothetical protein
MTPDLIATIVFGVLYVLLMYRQNTLLQEQNRVMSEQAGQVAAVKPSLSGRYWPMIAMATMTVLTWAAVGTWIHLRHTPPPSPTSEHIIPESSEEQAMKWLSEVNMPVRKAIPPPDFALWMLEVPTPNGQVVEVMRPKENNFSLVFGAKFVIPPAQVAVLGLQTQRQHDELVSDIKTEAVRQGMTYVFERPFDKFLLAHEVKS